MVMLDQPAWDEFGPDGAVVWIASIANVHVEFELGERWAAKALDAHNMPSRVTTQPEGIVARTWMYL